MLALGHPSSLLPIWGLFFGWSRSSPKWIGMGESSQNSENQFLAMLDYQRLFLAMGFFVPKIQESKLEESGDLWRVFSDLAKQELARNHPNRHGFLNSFPLPILASFFWGTNVPRSWTNTNICTAIDDPHDFTGGLVDDCRHVLKTTKPLDFRIGPFCWSHPLKNHLGLSQNWGYCSLLFCSPWGFPTKNVQFNLDGPLGLLMTLGFPPLSPKLFFFWKQSPKNIQTLCQLSVMIHDHL